MPDITIIKGCPIHGEEFLIHKDNSCYCDATIDPPKDFPFLNKCYYHVRGGRQIAPFKREKYNGICIDCHENKATTGKRCDDCYNKRVKENSENIRKKSKKLPRLLLTFK
jgi:hypothetical protein